MQIPYGCQSITAEDIDAVSDVLTTDFITQGPKVPEFERAIARYCGARHGVATNSATSALHIACLALSLGEGDLLWTTPNSFVASANCALYCGADVEFVDIERETGNLSVDALAEKCEKAQQAGRLPKVVIPVHFAGQSCDMKAIHALGKKFGFSIVEDASHALGGTYEGSTIGGCRYSDISVFSFHPVKMITTGEGGIALTNDACLSDKMRLLAGHGIVRNGHEIDSPNSSERFVGEWYYQQVELGYNYRLSDIHAALGLSQIERLNHYVERRNELAKVYDIALKSLMGEPLSPLSVRHDRRSSYHLYVVWLKLGKCIEERSQMRRLWFDQLRRQGIGVQVHYIPIPSQPFYRTDVSWQQDFPNMAEYYSGALTLPLFPKMSDAQQQYVIEALRSCAASIGKYERL